MIQVPETFNDVNHFKSIKYLQYNIVKFLIKNNDDLWKLLKYPDNDALFKDALSKDEKRDLIYGGEEDEASFRVFLQSYQDDLTTERQSRLYIDIAHIKPITVQTAIVTMGIDIISSNKILTLKDYTNRNTILLQNIISTLNGQDFGGINFLTFAYDKNGDVAVYQRSDTKMYSGFRVYMSCQVSDLGHDLEDD